MLVPFLIAQSLWPAVVFAQPRPDGPTQTPLAATAAPPVDDPMLAPVPPPRRTLSSWREAVGYLRARSTDLRIAVDQMRQAQAQTRIAIAQILPFVQGSGSYTRQLLTQRAPNGLAVVVAGGGVATTSTLPIPEVLDGAVQVKQSVFNVPLWDQIGIDRLSEHASELSVESKVRELVLGLANQIVAVISAEQSAQITRVGLKIALEQLELTTRGHQLGGSSALDVVRAEQNAANARAALVSGDELLRQAREALGLALGSSEETGVSPSLKLDGVAEDAMTECRATTSIEERADVAAARANVEVARRNLRNTWFALLPTLDARTTLEATSPVATGFPNPTWNLQGLLTIPIWDGGARYGTLRNERAAEDMAAAQLESLRRQTTIDVERARRGLVVAGVAVRVAAQQRDAAARNDDLTQKAYVAGEGTSLEMVTASEAHRRADLELELKESDAVRARIGAALALATCYP